MAGIADLTTGEFGARIERFDSRYLVDWDTWLGAVEQKTHVASEFGRILRSWQACRPNAMRRTRHEARHEAPFLDDLIAQSAPFVKMLVHFDLRDEASYTVGVCHATRGLWNTFLDLPYRGGAHQGKASVVGISKAVLLLTVGRVGPAFDSTVRQRMGIEKPMDAGEWLEALRLATRDIAAFERANGCTLQQATPERYRSYGCGRIYDMALGPGGGP